MDTGWRRMRRRMSLRISTSFDPKPIPVKFFDWEAWDDATYDGDETSIIGYGATKEEAIEDLLTRMWDRPERDAIRP